MRDVDFTLSDGRHLNLLVGDVASDEAVVFHHGTPAYSGTWRRAIAALEAEGLLGIAYSRAGYFTSDRKLGRTVLDVNEDISEVLEEFGIFSFASLGWSGGGPHALASGLDLRCTQAIVLAGVGKFGAPDLDFLAGMGEENVSEFGAALLGINSLEEWMAVNGTGLAQIQPEDLQQTEGSLFSTKDCALLKDYEFAAELAENFRSSVMNSFAGWIDDDIAFTREWGFDLEEITIPVHIIQGDQDLMVPASHGDWLANNLPNASLTKVSGYGHLGLFDGYLKEILKLIKR